MRIHSLRVALNELSASPKNSIYPTGFPAIWSFGKGGFDVPEMPNRGRFNVSDFWLKRSVGASFSKFKTGCSAKQKPGSFAIARG